MYFPFFIKADQTGFVKGHNSNNNMRRLPHTIQFIQKSLEGLLISLDAEKAFNHVEWPYHFHTLTTFGLSEQFMRWVKL